jgi:hypothetical protein
MNENLRQVIHDHMAQLPFPPARLQAAASLAGRFTAAWDSWSWRQTPRRGPPRPGQR